MRYKFIDTNINVSKIIAELERYRDDWNMVARLENTAGDTNPRGFLPLVMGVQEEGKSIKDSDKIMPTPAFRHFESVFSTLANYGIRDISRCAFFKLPPGEIVRTHIDDGQYYLNKDRFHLSILGEYEYAVDGEVRIIKPGTLFWFDNKKLHRAKNISNVDRITFVFDVYHGSSPIRDSNMNIISALP